MKKKIEDYLHLYGIDCAVMTPDGAGNIMVLYPKRIEVTINTIQYKQVMTGTKGASEMHWKFPYDVIKPLLRPLSSMTEMEIVEMMGLYGGTASFRKDNPFTHRFSPEQFRYLLSKHFDLFGLIEANLAIDSTLQDHQTEPLSS